MYRRFSARVLSLLLSLALALSLFSGTAVFAATGTLTANTATRHELCTALSSKALAYYVGDYTYENLSQLSGPASSTDSYTAMQNNELYTALQTLMKTTHVVQAQYNPSGEKPNELSYLWDFTDCEGGHSEYTYFFADIPADDIDDESMNREHVWPKSKASYYQKNGGTDLHHLRPSISSVNSAKSNRIFGNVYGVASDCKPHNYNGTTVFWLSASNGSLEVQDNIKGDVARILLYVWCRWSQPNLYSDVEANLLPPMDSDDSENNGIRAIESKETLLQWMELDPVDEWEMARNDQTENFQGNRNVFIDYPELAWLVLGEELPTDMPTPSGEAQNSGTGPCEHTWDDGIVTTPATCAEEGKMTYTCTLCGETKTEALPVTDHNWDDGIVGTPPTCTEPGTNIFTCTLCGEIRTEAIASAGHNYVETAVDPNCEVNGYIQHTCTVCGDTYYSDGAAALGHSWDEGTITTKATCTEDGVITYTCTVCSMTRSDGIAATGHSYFQSVVAPSCEDEGYTEYTCDACGDTYQDDTTAALGHDWDEGAVTTDPTCTEEGVTTFTCTREGCGATKTQAIAATGHCYSQNVVAPSCENGGYTEYTCEACGDTYQDDTTAALGHNWDEGAVTTEPTGTEEGVMTYTCTREGCGATKTEAIPALGEDPDAPCDGGADCPSARFTDIQATDWYHEAVDFAVENGLFGGMSENTFEPNTAMTRAMLVTVLWRYAGQPAEGSNVFTDVPEGQWYTDAVAWAAENSIVGGVGDNRFDPNGTVTREQLSAILYRYSNSIGLDTAASADLTVFPDGSSVSSWASDALSWAVAEGLVGGTSIDGVAHLDPQGSATRAQVATILMRFIENVVGE